MFTYNDKDPKSIEAHGKKMIGKRFKEICEEAFSKQILQEEKKEYLGRHTDKNFKGRIGNLVEECWFGYAANSDSNADFKDAGVELKVTPYIEGKRGYRAKERLVLTMINYMDIINENDFDTSHLWSKAQLMLLVWYLHRKGTNDIESTVDFVQLFTPPKEDLQIIKEDYKKILDKIKAGKAHELSEGDTLYLGACTKASSSTVRREQPFSNEPAKPRAFSFKNSYMTYVLNNYIIEGKTTYEPIIKEGDAVTDFEKYVQDKILSYKGQSASELCKRFNLNSSAKHMHAQIAFSILGVNSNRCEEFIKAGIAVKTIRINKNGTIKENMSFPPIDYQELAEETWDDCTFGNYLRDTRFFFIIYREDKNNILRLDGCKFWNIPMEDLESDVKAVWQETHDIIANGNLILDLDKAGRIINNLPKKKDHPISHVRPHGRNRLDTKPLPQGTTLSIAPSSNLDWPDDTAYTKMCFWLNNDYILKQIED